MQLWLDLEVELTRLLAEHAAAKGGAAQDALDDAIEVAVLRAEGIKDVLEPTIVLLLAWGLGSVIADVGTASFLARSLQVGLPWATCRLKGEMYE